jgi:hypothetical protein
MSKGRKISPAGHKNFVKICASNGLRQYNDGELFENLSARSLKVSLFKRGI